MLTRSKSRSIQSGYKLQTDNDTSVNLDLNGELHPAKANPLFIPEITDHLFQFLQLSDIKNCRSVCRTWNQVAEKFLKKLSVVRISVPDQLERLNQVFPNAQRSQIFTNFRLCFFNSPLYKFSDFCEKWYPNLSEITLYHVDFGWNNDTEPPDLSHILPSTLIQLRIDRCKPAMIISTDKICNIRILKLENCILKIVPGTTLNSVVIDLENVTFREDKENIDKFLINPLINFDVLKKASFSGKNIMLDFHGSHSLDLLSLQNGVTELNWETSNWEIKKLCICSYRGYHFEPTKKELSKSQIKYKELKIYLTQLDVSFLPDGIEKLQVEFYSVNRDQEVHPLISGEHNFPDLKHLNIAFKTEVDDFSPFMEVFRQCPKLTNLTVTSLNQWSSTRESSGEKILKTSSVPPSVKTFRLIGDVRIIVFRSLQLESLILEDPHDDGKYNTIVQLAKEFNVKNLYWYGHELKLDFGGYGNKYDNEIGTNFKSVIDLKLDNFVVGAFEGVNKSQFENSWLFPLVDTKGKYYLFQRGGKGKALSASAAIQFVNAFK